MSIFRRYSVYFALLGIVSASYLSGNIENPFRLFFFPLMGALIPAMNTLALLRISMIFALLYALQPWIQDGIYPVYTVSLNVSSFLLTGAVSGRISEILGQEKASFGKTADMYRGLVNALNMKILNLQAELDSLSEAHAHLRDLEKNRTRFITGTSNDITDRIKSIHSLSELFLIDHSSDNQTKEEFLGSIQSDAEKVRLLAREILEIVTIESVSLQPRLDDIDIDEIIKSAVRLMVPIAKDKGIPIRIRVPKKLPVIRGDNSRLLQVIINLLSNAVKFTFEGEIVVGAEDLVHEMKIMVSDTGRGIDIREKEKILAGLYNERPESESPVRSALGLSVSNKIIQAHGGKLGIDSLPGKGSTFFFTLPKQACIAEKAERVC